VFQQSSDGTVFRKTVSHEESSLQLASVQTGQTNYWVRAQDEQGNWGPWSQSQSSFSPDASFNFPVVPETTFVSGIPGESLSLNWNYGDGLSYYVTGLDENGSVTYTAHRATASIELSSEDLNGQGSIYIRSANDSGELSPVSPQVHFNFSGKTVVTSATEAGHPGPVINWVAVQGSGVVYQLQVQHVDTQEVVIREEALSENTVTPPDDLIAGTYRAWARVLADGFAGPWRTASAFVVG